MEVERGSYNADLGDRTYGIFDVVPRTGFERNRDAELVLSAGNFYQTNDQLSLGDHTEKFAWYASLNGNRSNFGLQPAISCSPSTMRRTATAASPRSSTTTTPPTSFATSPSFARDYYQIPYDPNPNDWENQLYDSSGLRDGEHETDSYGAFTWLHTFSANTVAQVSPFYHYNRTNYQPNPDDQPNATTADQTGMYYAAARHSFSTVIAHNTLSAGIYGYAQHENDLFGVVFNDGSASNFSVNPIVNAGVEETYHRGQLQTHLLAHTDRRRCASPTSPEPSAKTPSTPRIGIALQVPKLNWVFRALLWPLLPAAAAHQHHRSGPEPIAQTSNDSYRPAARRARRGAPVRRPDPLSAAGCSTPTPSRPRPKTSSTTTTSASPASSFPSPCRARSSRPGSSPSARPIYGASARLTSPTPTRSPSRSAASPAASSATTPHDSAVCDVAPGYSPLDHDQRNTLNLGFNGNLPSASSAPSTSTTAPASPTATQDPPSPYTGDYLPSHTTADLSLGRNFGERYTVSVNALNVGNTRVLLDNSLTFGGFHYNEPRQLYAELRYRFKF